jgi:hypothetical protein
MPFVEFHGQVVSTTNSNLGGPVFESWLRHRLLLLGCLVTLPVSPYDAEVVT